MILGIDAGMSALKIAVLDGEKCVLTHYARNLGSSAETLRHALRETGAENMAFTCAAVTGVGAGDCAAELTGIPVFPVAEIDAIGAGGAYLGGFEKALVVSLGTGSTFVLADHGEYTHVGGSGVGAGTVRGLGRKLFGTGDAEKLSALALNGDLGRVDVRVGDLADSPDTLAPDLTAANLAKDDPDASDADWALGILNLVLQSVGTMAVLICAGNGVKDVVLVGGLANQKTTPLLFEIFTREYEPDFHCVENAPFATAIGAACLAARQQKSLL